MDEPAKPFACSVHECGMTFTNEDHLHVHTKKHDMILQLGLEQKAAFVADQTPTPTRFIRNCEEVGLFQDLQNVSANPFDEGFKRAMETKTGILSLEATIAPSDDVLHTPQMVFPLLDNGEPTLFNTQRNITISRSSSDESSTIKEFETRTISKLTNEVTTISRIITDHTDDVTITHTDKQKDVETVSYQNNIIRIESNVIRKDKDINKPPARVYSDSVIKGSTKDTIIDNSKLHPVKLPIISQKSIDFVVDNLTSDLETNGPETVTERSKNEVIMNVRNDEMATIRKVFNKAQPKKLAQPKIVPKNTVQEKKKEFQTDGYEVMIKLPNGKQVRMKPVEECNTKEVVRNKLTKKIITKQPNLLKQALMKPNIVKIPTGMLIPVTLVDQQGTPLSGNDLNNVPITRIGSVSDIANIKLPEPNLFPKPKPKLKFKRKVVPVNSSKIHIKVSEPYQIKNVTVKRGETKESCNVNKAGSTAEDVSKIITETKESYNVNQVGLTSEDVSKILTEAKESHHLNRVRLTAEDVSKQIEERMQDTIEEDDDCVLIEEDPEKHSPKRQRIELERRCAASKRYRERLKEAMQKQTEENKKLRESNQRLIAEKAVLKLLITEHMRSCPNSADIATRLSLLTNGVII